MTVLKEYRTEVMPPQSCMKDRVIKLMAFVEAGTVTGPAKNLFEFCRRARPGGSGKGRLPDVVTSIATFDRGPGGGTRRYQAAHVGDVCGASSQFVSAACKAGIDVDVIGERFVYDWDVISKMRRLVDEHSPDIIQTHSVKSHLLMRISGLWRQRPWVAFHHGYTTPNLKMRAYNLLDHWSLRVPAQVITVSQAFARQLERSGVATDRIRVLHNSINPDWTSHVDIDQIKALKELHGIETGEKVILAVGRLSHEKAHVDLVEALAHLGKSHPEIRARLVIVGEGPERQRIEQLAGTLGVQKSLILTGQVSDVSVYYAMSDIFVLPSLSEGSPNVLLEAMAASIPIIASAVGGIPEIVSHNESALLVIPRAPKKLSEAMARVLSDPCLADFLIVNARTKVVDEYSPDARTRALIDIYVRMLQVP